MKSLFVSSTFALAMSMAASAQAVCGDVTGDQEKTTSDALAVLRSAVGQQVALVCDEGPSRIRFSNATPCNGESQTATLSFNGLEYSAGYGVPTEYQVVDRLSIDNVQATLCGGQVQFFFEGPFHLPRNRSITAILVIGHPDIYESESELPAFLVLRDNGIPADGSLLQSAEEPAAGEEAAVFVGELRRREP
jgi:hypothetical protein